MFISLYRKELHDYFVKSIIRETVPECQEKENRTECIGRALAVEDFNKKLDIQYNILKSVRNNLSKDGGKLEGYEFVIFFM